jgi:hypothetical protein
MYSIVPAWPAWVSRAPSERRRPTFAADDSCRTVVLVQGELCDLVEVLRAREKRILADICLQSFRGDERLVAGQPRRSAEERALSQVEGEHSGRQKGEPG